MVSSLIALYKSVQTFMFNIYIYNLRTVCIYINTHNEIGILHTVQTNDKIMMIDKTVCHYILLFVFFYSIIKTRKYINKMVFHCQSRLFDSSKSLSIIPILHRNNIIPTLLPFYLLLFIIKIQGTKKSIQQTKVYFTNISTFFFFYNLYLLFIANRIQLCIKKEKKKIV